MLDMVHRSMYKRGMNRLLLSTLLISLASPALAQYSRLDEFPITTPYAAEAQAVQQQTAPAAPVEEYSAEESAEFDEEALYEDTETDHSTQLSNLNNGI